MCESCKDLQELCKALANQRKYFCVDMLIYSQFKKCF